MTTKRGRSALSTMHMPASPELPQRTSSNKAPNFLNILWAERVRLKGLALWLTRDHDAAADLVQETLIRAWHAREQFAQGTKLECWLNTIMRNYYFSQLRKARQFADYAQATIVEESVDCHCASAVDADLFARRIRLLPDSQQAVLFGLSSGESYEHCAQRLGIPVGTVKSRMNRAREALQAEA